MDMSQSCGMRNYRTVCSKFSESDGFNGWVIAKAEIDNLSDDTFNTTCVEKCIIAKKRKRFAVLETSVPAYTVDMQCGSALETMAIAAAKIKSCQADIIIAGGFESSSTAPGRRYNKNHPDYEKMGGAHYEMPRRFIVMDSLPKNESGKINTDELKKINA